MRGKIVLSDKKLVAWQFFLYFRGSGEHKSCCPGTRPGRPVSGGDWTEFHVLNFYVPNFYVPFLLPNNGVFDKWWFCVSDTLHFRHFRRFGSKQRSPLFLWVEIKSSLSLFFVKTTRFSVVPKGTHMNRIPENYGTIPWKCSVCVFALVPLCTSCPQEMGGPLCRVRGQSLYNVLFFIRKCWMGSVERGLEWIPIFQ